MRVILLHNPKAGDKNRSRSELVARIRAAGHEVIYQSARKRNWEAVLEHDCDLIAVAGGDGTIAKVAKRLLGRRIPIAVLPTGTANNILKTLRLADAPIEKMIPKWSTAPRKKFDLGIARGPWGSRPFMESLGIGLFASTMSRLDSRGNIHLVHLDNPGQKLAAVISMLLERLKEGFARRLEISIDGKDLCGEYIIAEIMNTGHVGPNLNFAPRVKVDDGQFDVVLLKDTERPVIKKYLSNLLKGRSSPPGFRVRKARQVQFKWEGFDIHIDDEVWPEHGSGFELESTLIDIEIEHQALEFLSPKVNPSD
jgi:diacylglycerol kinase family enzyme